MKTAIFRPVFASEPNAGTTKALRTLAAIERNAFRAISAQHSLFPPLVVSVFAAGVGLCVSKARALAHVSGDLEKYLDLLE